MPLATVDSLKIIPGMPGDYSQSSMEAAIRAAETVAENWCKRKLLEAIYTEYYDGTGRPELILRQRPVRVGVGSGLLTVKVDQTGHYGFGNNAFDSDAWVHGADYVLKMDDGGAQSTSGVLMRVGSMGGVSNLQFAPWISDYPRTGLTSGPAPYWPRGYGNVKVTYTAGYAVAPPDLEEAVAMLAVWLLRNSPFGGQEILQGETFIDVSYTLGGIGTAGLQAGSAALGSVRQILGRYREVAIGVGAI